MSKGTESGMLKLYFGKNSLSWLNIKNGGMSPQKL